MFQVMPVENVMRKPSDFLGCPSVLNISMVLIWILYNVVGALGYIRFGDDIEGSVTLNLSHDWYLNKPYSLKKRLLL